MADDLVTWEPEASRGEAKRGRPRQSYLSTLLRDVGINTKEELLIVKSDRDTMIPIQSEHFSIHMK